MLNHEEKFLEQVKKYFVKHSQNNNLPAIINKAKFWEIDYNEALSIIKSNWIGTFEKNDENSFKRCWNDATKDPKETISTYKKLSTEDKISIVENNKKIDFNNKNLNKLYNYLMSIELYKDYKMPVITKTSKDLLYWYDKNDIIWISKTFDNDSQTAFKDVLEFSEKSKALSIYSYMCVNDFKSDEIIKREDKNVKHFRYLLVEFDDLELTLQMKLFLDMVKFGVPIKSIIYSGGKSFHTLLYINAESLEEYIIKSTEIYSLFEFFGAKVDNKVKNPSRLTRIPFGQYDKPGDNQGNEQECCYVNPSLTSEKNTYEELKKYFKSIGISEKEEEKTIDEIEKMEILNFVDRSIIFDCWRSGSKYFAMVKKFGDPSLTERGARKIESFNGASAFYDYCFQYLDKSYKGVFSAKDIRELTVRYKQDFFKPCLKKDNSIKANYINIFKPGWLSQVIEDESIPCQLNDKLKIFINNLFGSDILAQNWTFKWMHVYMHNFIKMKTAPVFWGIPGCGKSMIAEAFGQAIGNCKSPKQNQIEDVRFNNWVRNAVLILDEVSSGSKRDGKTFGDYLKGLITQDMQSIELKGVDTSDDTLINNCFIFTANISKYIPPVFIEKDDRRYTIIRNDNAKNLRELWTDEDFKLWDNGTYKKILMKWIYFTEFDQSIDVNKGLPNQYKAEIEDMGKNNVEIVANEFYQDHLGQTLSIEEIKTELNENYSERYSQAMSRIFKKLGAVDIIKKKKINPKYSKTFRMKEFKQENYK